MSLLVIPAGFWRESQPAPLLDFRLRPVGTDPGGHGADHIFFWLPTAKE